MTSADQWNERDRPPRLECRLLFDDYAATRTFLERAAELSEQTGVFPDLSFGRTYVNVTVHTAEGADRLDDRQRDFARALSALAHGGD